MQTKLAIGGWSRNFGALGGGCWSYGNAKQTQKKRWHFGFLPFLTSKKNKGLHFTS
jgi:hypothetical protein